MGKIVDRYNETGSLHPGDYREDPGTWHASYALTVIGVYLATLPAH